ncbi:hypothetical protein LXA47_11305 [Massilia sp. P8910]|uniref:hypothetical protein n=1 Tax=Massilia antarctica TaxID=2765360 RepID=UPI001E45EA6B|nr:hypothetical protein [Massilia antarctica]MCE3604190.1 hypothetical protein [Massilia antarctica]
MSESYTIWAGIGLFAGQPAGKKKARSGSGLNLFSWRRIEETDAVCCAAENKSN